MTAHAVVRARRFAGTRKSCFICHSRLRSETDVEASSIECRMSATLANRCSSVARGKMRARKHPLRFILQPMRNKLPRRLRTTTASAPAARSPAHHQVPPYTATHAGHWYTPHPGHTKSTAQTPRTDYQTQSCARVIARAPSPRYNYSGMIIAALPTPNPTTNRPTVICATEYDTAWMMEPRMNTAQPA